MHVLEDLPNEVIEEIFEYLHDEDLRNFDGLNRRLNILLAHFRQVYHWSEMMPLPSARRLTSLRHLSIVDCHFEDQSQFDELIDRLWRLPKLTSCSIDRHHFHRLRFPSEVPISHSLRTLSFSKFPFDFDDLVQLFRHTPSLRHLFMNLIQGRSSLTGHHWEKLIVHHLPHLLTFRLRMEMKFSPRDELLDSFRTSFWLEERRWFVQCRSFTCGILRFGILYTVPYSFDEFLFTHQQWSKSTGPNDEHCFDQVHTLTVINTAVHLPDFRHLSHLKLDLPLDTRSWSNLPALDRLISLKISFVDRSVSRALQTLLDRSPRLRSIGFVKDATMNTAITLSNPSVDQLEFPSKQFFDDEQCSLLSTSPLGRQCQRLFIGVKHRTGVLTFLSKMPHLRSLVCQCVDDPLDGSLISWFHLHLPAQYSIIRDDEHRPKIRISL